MKTKRIFLALFLCFCSVFTVFGLVGCKDVTLGTLKESYEILSNQISQNSQVFAQDGTLLVESYGKKVDANIIANKSEYVELRDLYNSTLTIAFEYAQENKDFILLLDEAALNKASKAALKTLNASVNDFANSIPRFVEAHQTFVAHFQNFSDDAQGDASVLLRFKKTYGEMVKKCVDFSSNTAKMVESTEIFELLKKTQPSAADTITISQYIRAKLLPIFSEFKITEIANKMNWQLLLNNGDAQMKQTLQALVGNLDTHFANYKQTFLHGNIKTQPLSSEEINDVFNLTENFLVEMESFFQALYGLDLNTFASVYKNNMKEYLKTNQFAEVYLQKLQQFVNVSLDNFIKTVSSKLYV